MLEQWSRTRQPGYSERQRQQEEVSFVGLGNQMQGTKRDKKAKKKLIS